MLNSLLTLTLFFMGHQLAAENKPLTVQELLSIATQAASPTELIESVEKSKRKVSQRTVLDALEENFKKTPLEKKERLAGDLVALHSHLGKNWAEKNPKKLYALFLVTGGALGALAIYFTMRLPEENTI